MGNDVYIDAFWKMLDGMRLSEPYRRLFRDEHPYTDLGDWLRRVVPEHYVSGAFPWTDSIWSSVCDIWKSICNEMTKGVEGSAYDVYMHLLDSIKDMYSEMGGIIKDGDWVYLHELCEQLCELCVRANLLRVELGLCK